MRHFSAERWCDFVRGVTEAGARAAMRDHLESGCRQCRRQVDWLERVVASAGFDGSQAPPEYVVRSVKAYFELDRSRKKTGLALVRLPAVYDSGLAPASTGVRSSDAEARHLAYEAGGYAVELGVGRAAVSGESVVEGRLLAEPAEPMTEVPTFVLSGGKVVTTAFTGEQGHFSARCRLQGTCELLFLPEGRPAIGVGWESPSSPRSP